MNTSTISKLEISKSNQIIFRPDKVSPSIHRRVRDTRETKRTYFCLKAKPFYSKRAITTTTITTLSTANVPRDLGARFGRDDIEIMRAMPEAARHKRPQLLEHKSAGRNSSRPRRPIHASKSWKPEDSGFHRDRERWKPFDESRLRIYGGTLLKRPSPLSLSLSFGLLSSPGSRIGLSCFTVPFGETAAEDSRFDIC